MNQNNFYIANTSTINKNNTTIMSDEDNNRTPFVLKEKIGDMMKYGKREADKFPSRERETSKELKRSMFNMYKLAISLQKKYYKKTTLQELDVELDVLRHLVRLASDKDYYENNIAPPLSMKKYKYWSSLLDEIGRILGGYMNYVKRTQK